MVPATVQLVAPAMLKVWQVPAMAPAALTQLPVQHMSFEAHVSFSCRQKEEAGLHLPAVQSFEQHSLLLAQLSPEPWQLFWSCAQVPPVHLPVQHERSLEQALPSG